ncbi:MAG TPA: polyprenyl synthetase family protein [Pyrinomonadaceae bacterium]|nr:polyprenyl synthetase family protein [Pyrinomonadaceae bacterium]
MTERLKAFIARHGAEIEDALRTHLPYSSQPGARRLNDALDYALFPGGKRLRPLLALAAARLGGATDAQGITVGCAVEFLHSSSLILDDLPAMDDANLRRNRRALHLVYGEGLAMLAAVALLNQAYALLTRAAAPAGNGTSACATAALLGEAARAVGADGMIGGQAVDLELQAAGASERALASRDLKTVALMRLMMVAGARAVGAEDETVGALAAFGERFGRVYQICDDLSDEACDGASSGKDAGQDARHLRPSAVSVLGRSASQNLAASLVGEGALLLFEKFGEREETRLLVEAAEMLLDKVKAAGACQLPGAGSEQISISDAEQLSLTGAEQLSVA